MNKKITTIDNLCLILCVIGGMIIGYAGGFLGVVGLVILSVANVLKYHE